MWGPLLPSCSPGSERRTRCHPLIVLSRRLIGFGGLIASEGREGALPLWRPGPVRTNQARCEAPSLLGKEKIGNFTNSGLEIRNKLHPALAPVPRKVRNKSCSDFPLPTTHPIKSGSPGTLQVLKLPKRSSFGCVVTAEMTLMGFKYPLMGLNTEMFLLPWAGVGGGCSGGPTNAQGGRAATKPLL